MGGRSHSSSSTSSSQSTQNTDKRVSTDNGGVGIGADAQVTINATDYGVIKGAAKVLDQGLKTSAGIVKNVTDSFGKAMKDNTAMLDANLKSDSTEMAKLMVKVIGGFGALVAVLMVFGRSK